MHCIYCGFKLSDNDNFCTKCGKVIVKAKVETNTPTKTSRKSILTNPLILFIIVLTILGAIAYGNYSKTENSDKLTSQNTINTGNSNNSNIELVKQTVNEIKLNTKLPQQTDEVTKWVDITAEGTAIRYHYVISGLDTSNLTSTDLKSVLIKDMCNNKEFVNMLNYGIDAEYSYIVEKSSDKFFFVVSKNDCL